MNEDCSQDADCYVAFIIVIFRSLATLNRANCRVNSPHRTTNVRQQQGDIWRMLLYLFIVPFHQATTLQAFYGLLRPSNHTPAPQISTVACNFLNTYADILQRVSLHLQTSHFVFSTRLLTIVTHPWNYDTQPPATTTLCCSLCNSIRVIQFLL